MKRLFLALTIALFAAVPARAQMGGAPNTGINASLVKMFGDTKAFTAKGDVRISDGNGKEVSSMPVSWALLDGKLRADMDMSQMKGGSVPPEATAMLKQTGMDKMQLLVNPASKTTLIIYPGLQAYAPVPDEAESGSKVETTDVGKETIDGHPCLKKKMTTTDADGKVQEAFLWSATDLKNFPVKMEMKQKNNTVLIQFSTPSFDKPDAKLFEVPANYTKHASIQGLMQAAMMKMFGGAK
ncbi:MAG TPA: DUF4412 domain-containing protein [Candidatus Acidoferrum sp.]|nr:DUF4412 domain-containing protein [Candidatus Acidoferrum sp.]